MHSPVPKRLYFYVGVCLLLAALLIARWFSRWGLVTIHVQDAPLGQVIASISRQGHVRVETSLDPGKRVGLDVELVTPATALDILSSRIGENWRVIYLAAPSRDAVENAVASLRSKRKLEDWVMRFYPMPSVAGGGATIDPRGIVLKLEGPDTRLPGLLDQASQKTGVMTLIPVDWTPEIAPLPKEGRTGRVIAGAVEGAHGKLAEVLFLSDEGGRWRGGRDGNRPEGGGPPPPPREGGGDPFAGLNAGRMKPEWREERVAAQIAQLPPAQREEAKRDVDQMRQFFQQLRDLPPEERRTKWEELMSNPDFVDRMENNRAARDQVKTAEQQIQRGVSYIERRQSALSGQNSPK